MVIADPAGLVGRIKKHLQMAEPVSFNLQQWGYSPSRRSFQLPNSLLQIVAQSNFHGVLDQMHHLSSVPDSVLQTATIEDTTTQASALTSPLGKFVSLSNSGEENRVQIHAVEAASANQVPRQVFSAVLHGAQLALQVQHGTIDAFYFVKENIYDASNDIKMLRKLGPSVNLTSHDLQSGDGNVMMDVKVHLENTLVSVRYGASLAQERARILHHAAKVTTRRAWLNQKELLLSKRKTQWSPYEKEQILRQGSVSNYKVEFLKDLNEFPELAADLSNVVFVPVNTKNGNH